MSQPSQRSLALRSWMVLLPAMVLPFAASLFYFVWFSDHLFSRILYGMTKLFTLVWPVCVVELTLGECRPRFKWRDPVHARALPWGVVWGVLMVGAMFGVMQTPVGEVVRAGTDDIRGKVESLGVLDHYWVFGMFIALLHSLLEEYYWRWFVFGRLARLVPMGWAHGLGGLAFALHHIVITTQYFSLGWGLLFGSLVGVGGVIWSLLYTRQRTLAGAWVSHIIVDLGILSLGHKLLFGTYY